MDFYLHRSINIVPIVVVDYSLSNLTFDDDRKCIHTLKPGMKNDYEDVLRALMSGYKHVSEFMMGFGIGAKTIPKKGEASDCLSLTGDIFSPTFAVDELYDKYAESLKNVELSLPVNYAKVVELAAAYARYEKENYECRNYFVLTFVSVGVIDDFADTLDALKNMGDLPLSV